MATKKVARPKTKGNAAKAPADVLREQKARIAEASKVPVPRLSGTRHPASDAAEMAGDAHRVIGEIQVPMTLTEICDIIGPDVHGDDFASSSLEAIGDQIYTLATLVETDASHDSWRLFRNLSDRAKLASRVTSWLASEKASPASLEVQP